MNERTKEIAERHRTRQLKKKRRLAFSITVMFVLILALSSFLALMLTPLCNVRSIKVMGNERVSVAAVENTLAADHTTKVYQINKKLAKQRLETLPYVKNAQIKTHIWGSVEVNIEEAKIGGYMMFEKNAVIFDETGKIVNVTGEIPEDIMKIEGTALTSASAGEKLSIDTGEKFDIILMYISEFEKSGILNKMTMLDVSDILNVKAIYDNRYDVFFGDFADLEHKIAMMKQAVARNAENEMGTIDLRISNNAYVKPSRSFGKAKTEPEKNRETEEEKVDIIENETAKEETAKQQKTNNAEEENGEVDNV